MEITEKALIALSSALYQHVYELTLAWFGFIMLLFIALLLRYTFGIGFTAENPNPYRLETFAMPRGVFRGIISLSLLFLVMLLEVIDLRLPVMTAAGNLIAQQAGDKVFFPIERHHELMVAFQMMLAFYFGSKVMHHVTKADERKAQLGVLSASNRGPVTDENEKSDEIFDQSGSVG